MSAVNELNGPCTVGHPPYHTDTPPRSLCQRFLWDPPHSHRLQSSEGPEVQTENISDNGNTFSWKISRTYHHIIDNHFLTRDHPNSYNRILI